MGVNGNEGATAGAKTVTVMVIHPNFKTVTVTVIFGRYIFKSNKTAGNNFDSNGIFENPCDRDPPTGNFKNFKLFKNSQEKASAEIRGEFFRTKSRVNFAGDFLVDFFGPFSLEK